MDECPVCGEEAHEPIPSMADSWLGGIPLAVCPNLPERAVWVSSEYEHGPSHTVFLLPADA